jgi:hypothetical protein
MAEDTFESSTGTSDTTVDYKYAQLAVPSYELDVASTATAATSTTNTAESSFVRLGSFPAHTTSDTDLPGFSKSLTLAKLVGDTSTISAYATAADADPDGSHILRDDVFAGDKVVGFADDTRFRKDATDSKLYVDGANKTNSTENRKTETKRLLTKGGWWDHAGGNRITTTAGDKIEVIQGNYKLVVLGRREPTSTNAGKGKITDVSGGKEFSKTYEYSETTDSDGNAIWSTYEESSEAYATKVTSGVEVSYFEGTKKETNVGEDPEGVHITNPKSYFKSSNPDRDPEVISRTWAKKMETYVGSINKPVPHVFSIAYTLTREEVTISTEIVSTRVAAANFTQLNAGLTFLDTKVAGIVLLAMNVAPILVKIDAAYQTYDLKYGYVHAVAPAANKINALANDLVAARNWISTKATNISTNLSNFATATADVVGQQLTLVGQNMAIYNGNNMLGLQHMFM